MYFRFSIEAIDGKARAGRMVTPHGVIETPVSMPAGTLGTVNAVAQDVLEELGVQILLNNTYHLYLRPDVEMVRSLGRVQRFMAWDKLILTDSGRLPSIQPERAAQGDGRQRGVPLAPRRIVAPVYTRGAKIQVRVLVAQPARIIFRVSAFGEKTYRFCSAPGRR